MNVARSDNPLAKSCRFGLVLMVATIINGCGKSTEQMAAEDAAMQKRATAEAQAQLDLDRVKFAAMANATVSATATPVATGTGAQPNLSTAESAERQSPVGSNPVKVTPQERGDVLPQSVAVVDTIVTRPYRCIEGGKAADSDKPCVGDTIKVPVPSASLAPNGAAPVNLQNEAGMGRIAVGMTAQQVEEAWGRAADVSTETDAQGKTERWAYIRNSEATEVSILNGTVSKISSHRAPATSATSIDAPVLISAAEVEEQERADKADERRFIRKGMTENAVRLRIGPPVSRQVVNVAWGVGTCWLYLPEPNDQQTRTTICFKHDTGQVITVDRVVQP